MPVTRSKSGALPESATPPAQSSSPSTSAPAEATLAILKKNITDSTPICFWKPHQDYGFLGQWYKSNFKEPETGATFHTAEQYMMYHKAVLFGDMNIAAAILEVPNNPKAQKALGRKVSNFDERIWDQNKLEIVTRGNVLKFTQCVADPDDKFVYPSGDLSKTVSLKELLFATGDRELVETSSLDRVWGVGFNQTKALQVSRDKWGKNLLGVALMDARKRIRDLEGSIEE